ncbi:hypothetical protein CAAN1_13S03994 [[Candida] anglica]|uniref:Golgi pH regulator n=1 Tax=[Candida] anglica TaxID=148631 RepID=A0ABP0EGD3_9ASCO
MLSFIFSVVPFISSFTLIFTLCFTFTYNHNLIPSYLNPSKIPKSQINAHIQKLKGSYRLGSVVPFDIEGELDEDDDKAERFHPTRSKGGPLISDKIIRTIFSFGLTLSFHLVVLILLELVGESDESKTRVFLFQLVIDSLILLLTFVQPYLIIGSVLFQQLIPTSSTPNLRKTLAVVLMLLWFFALHKFGTLSQSFSPELNLSSSRSLIERKINEVSIAGITIMAILSGIGSASTPYELFSLRKVLSIIFKSRVATPTNRKTVTEMDLNNLAQSYNHTNLLINKRKSQLNSLLVKEGGTIYNLKGYTSSDNILHNTNTNSLNPPLQHPASSSTASLGGFMHKVQSFASLSSLGMGGKENSEEKELTDEIKSLKELNNHIYDDFLKMLDKYRIQQDASSDRKLVNLLLKWFNLGFGLYCVYRIFNVLVLKFFFYLFTSSQDISDNESGTPPADTDALAITLAKIILSFTSFPISETQMTYQISFFLSGGLFICSISNVLTTLKSFKKFLPQMGNNMSPTTITWLKHMIISELLGIYVLSTALLIRTNLPQNLSIQVSKILSLTGSMNSVKSARKEVEFIDSWFDKVFGITCIVTLLVLILRNYLDDDLDDEYDEESMIDGTQYSKFAY